MYNVIGLGAFQAVFAMLLQFSNTEPTNEYNKFFQKKLQIFSNIFSNHLILCYTCIFI